MKKKTQKRIRNTIGILVILLVTLFFFRGCAYRTVVSYKEVGSRKNYKVKDKNLAASLENNIPQGFPGDIESIIDLSQEITSNALSFSAESKENDPSKTVLLRNANCIGYAAFTATTGNYLIDKYKLSKVWEAKPVKGKIFLFGKEITSKSKNKILKDHDFVIFKNKVTKREIAVDPTVHDYFKIDRISNY